MRENMDTHLPTIRANELATRAATFAYHLASKLDGVNAEYPAAELEWHEQEMLEKNFGGTLPGPTPTQFIQAFERVFFT